MRAPLLRHGRALLLGVALASSAVGATPGRASAGEAIDAWGDSLTSGTPAMGSPKAAWPYQLSELLDGRLVRNFGVSGQTSSEIAARQGALVARLTITGEPAADGAVPVTLANDVPMPGEGAPRVHGSLNGTPGTLLCDADAHRYSFLPDIAGSAPARTPGAAPFFVDDHRDDINVLWAGRNDVLYKDATQTIENVERMAANVHNGRFIVLSILNAEGEPRGSATYRTVETLNRELEARFPGHFVDVRAALVEAAGTTRADRGDRAADIVPASLRVDDEHLNAHGYHIVAQQVADYVVKHGW